LSDPHCGQRGFPSSKRAAIMNALQFSGLEKYTIACCKVFGVSHAVNIQGNAVVSQVYYYPEKG